MEIHWDKWTVESLPFRFRKRVMVAFCTVLVAPLQTLYNDFNQYRKKMKIKAGGSPQVCMLQKIVKDSLGIDLVISEGNGKPVDFIIHTSFTDVDKERQLFSLVDRYKLAGKSYMYENAEVEYSHRWGGFVCERKTLIIQWGGYVCEIKYRPINYAYYSFSNNRVYITMQFPPASDLMVEFSSRGMDENGETSDYLQIVKIPKGTSGQMSAPWDHKVDSVFAKIEPREDDFYLYGTKWNKM